MNNTQNQNQVAYFTPFNLLTPLILAAVFIVLNQTSFFDKLENLTLDQRIRIRHASQPPLDSRIFLVGVDDISLEKLGQWPFDRNIHAQFMQILSQGRPSVFAWDVIFDTYKSGSNTISPSGQAFADTCLQLNVPVLTAAVGSNEVTRTSAKDAAYMGWTPSNEVINSRIVNSPYLIAPIPEIAKNTKTGIVTANRHDDGVVRKIPLVIRIDKKILPNLALQSLIQFWKLDPEKNIRIVPGDAIYIQSPLVKRRIPIDEKGFYVINYRYELDDLINTNATGSYVQMIIGYRDKYLRGRTDLSVPDIGGKITLIGQIAPGMADLGRSPLSGLSPMVMTHVNTLDNILKSDFLYTPPAWSVWLIFMFISYLTFILPIRLDFWLKVSIPILLTLAYLGTALYLFILNNIDLPIISPSLAFLILHTTGIGREVLAERKARENLRNTFSAYVAPGILNSIHNNPNALKLGGAKKDVAILFTDIRSFTSMTEVMDSEILVAQLNEYFTQMVDGINTNGGTLHKFIGDAIMAVWGDIASTSPTIDAGRALQAALLMRHSLDTLNLKWRQEDRPEFKMGIGINYGQVTVGNIGAPQRMEFTVIGDSVNLAARLESLNKKFGTEILVGESMHNLTHERFLFRPIAKVQVVGKQAGVQVYEVLCEAGKPDESPYDINWVHLYEEGYARFMERRFDVAVRLFEACLNDYSEDKSCKLLLEASRQFQQNSPPAHWDGTFEMTSK